MKKLRIYAIIVALILTITALASCDTLKLEDVQADPLKYVTDGADLTFGSTPFADISLDQDKVSYQLGVDGENEHLDLALYLDMVAMKGAFDLAMENTYSYMDDKMGPHHTNPDEPHTSFFSRSVSESVFPWFRHCHGSEIHDDITQPHCTARYNIHFYRCGSTAPHH